MAVSGTVSAARTAVVTIRPAAAASAAIPQRDIHLFFILLRIGLSRLAGYRSFSALVDRCIAHRSGTDSYIVVTPALSGAGQQALRRLQAYSDTKLCVLFGEEKRT